MRIEGRGPSAGLPAPRLDGGNLRTVVPQIRNLRSDIGNRPTRWIAAAGAFVVGLDSIMNIAFPAMAAAFHVLPEQMRWVIISYVFTYSLMSFFGGSLADRIGHARVFRAGLALSVIGFVLAGFASRFRWLLAGRVVQGFGGGFVYGTAPALVTLAAPPAVRGRALGFLNATIGLASAAGPPLAGALVEAFGWRAVFHIRVPLALVALAGALVTLPSGPAAGGTHRLVTVRDLVRVPVLHASALAFVSYAGIFAIWLLAPFYLVERRGLDATVGGVLFMLTPLGITLAAPLAGWIADRVGARIPVVTGLAVEAAGLMLMSRADETTPAVMLALVLFATGIGLGVFQVPNMVTVMAAFPPAHQGAAGGLTFMARTLGVVAGVTTLAQVFAVRRHAAGFDAAFSDACLVAAGAVAAAAVLALVPLDRPVPDGAGPSAR